MDSQKRPAGALPPLLQLLVGWGRQGYGSGLYCLGPVVVFLALLPPVWRLEGPVGLSEMSHRLRTRAHPDEAGASFSDLKSTWLAGWHPLNPPTEFMTIACTYALFLVLKLPCFLFLQGLDRFL